MALPKIKCAKCGGTGKTELPEKVAEVLEIILRKKRVTTSQVWDEVCRRNPDNDMPDRASINHRIDQLVSLGFVKSEKKDGEFRTYFPK